MQNYSVIKVAKPRNTNIAFLSNIYPTLISVYCYLLDRNKPVNNRFKIFNQGWAVFLLLKLSRHKCNEKKNVLFRDI